MTTTLTSVPPNPAWRNERRREIRLRRSALLSDQAEGAVTYKIATEQKELEASFELVYRSYVEVGLQAVDINPIRFTKYHLLPTTKVFIAIHRPELMKQEPRFEQLKEPGEIVGTMTLVGDSPLGLPMEEVCRESVQQLRREGGNPAEVIALAVNPAYRNCNIMMYLYQLMFAFADLTNVSDITCSATKRHIHFYRTMLLFEPISELRSYSAANGLEVQCHRLNIKRSREMAKEVYHDRHFDADLYTFFFTQNVECRRKAGKGEPWDERLLRYFLTERTRFLDTLDDETLSVLRRVYLEAGLAFPF